VILAGGVHSLETRVVWPQRPVVGFERYSGAPAVFLPLVLRKDLTKPIYSGCTVREEYDPWANGRISRVSVTEYNAAGAPTFRRADSDGDGKDDATQKWIYDARGNLIETVGWNAAGVRTGGEVMAYDRDGRLIRREIDSDGDGDPETVVTFEYDLRGNKVAEYIDEDVDGKAEKVRRYSYDQQDRLVREEFQYHHLRNVTYHTWEGALRTKMEKDVGDDGVIDQVAFFYYTPDGLLTRDDYDWGVDGLIDHWYLHSYDQNGWHVKGQYYLYPGDLEWTETMRYDAGGRKSMLRMDHEAYGPSAYYWTNVCP
jgi:hypothetical protein